MVIANDEQSSRKKGWLRETKFRDLSPRARRFFGITKSLVTQGAPVAPERPETFSFDTIMAMPIEFATVEEAAEEFRQGRQIVVVDDEDRENEGDLVVAAGKVPPPAPNFMAKHGRGPLSPALTHDLSHTLTLPLVFP